MTATILDFPAPAQDAPAGDLDHLAAPYFTAMGMPPGFALEHGLPSLAAAMRALDAQAARSCALIAKASRS